MKGEGVVDRGRGGEGGGREGWSDGGRDGVMEGGRCDGGGRE